MLFLMCLLIYDKNMKVFRFCFSNSLIIFCYSGDCSYMCWECEVMFFKFRINKIIYFCIVIFILVFIYIFSYYFFMFLYFFVIK